MYASKPQVEVVRICVGLNIHVCGIERDGVTPLYHFQD